MEIMVWPPGTLTWNRRRVRCALGRGGVRAEKREGDGATPAGTFPLRRVLYRADRLPPPETGLPVKEIKPGDGWCDDPADADYNRPVTRLLATGHETMWRDDNVYDVVVPLGYNDDPVEPGLGSAIFLHVARLDFGPTKGCVALALGELLDLLRACDESTQLSVSPGPPSTAPPAPRRA